MVAKGTKTKGQKGKPAQEVGGEAEGLRDYTIVWNTRKRFEKIVQPLVA